MEIFGNKKIKEKLGSQDKGHTREFELFIESIFKGSLSPISFDALYHSSKMTFAVLESVNTGKTIVA